MSIDRLQEKIRKTKNPTLLDFDIQPEQIPPHLLKEEGSFDKAYTRFCMELMEAFMGIIPAVRFSFAGFALLGTQGLCALSLLLDKAKQMGFYVLLEIPEALSAQRAACNAELLMRQGTQWPCDGYILCAYGGSDGVKPYAQRLEQEEKSLFLVARSGNKSAFELQDLLTGGRFVYEAKTDMVNRFQNVHATHSGYDRIGVVGPATSGAILQKLRSKYKNLFLLVDGYDYSGANAKNCAEAADRFGHGMIVSSGAAITAAWMARENDGLDYITDAKESAERMKKNLLRYFAVL